MDKETVDRAMKDAEAAFKIYINYKTMYDAAFNDYMKKKRRFESFDRELAQTDGRLKVCKPAEKAKPKEVTLSLEQIQQIADLLHIDISEKEQQKDED